ncbi:MAG: hypothetical protein N4A49_08115 [Marinifilaceae bacterium]|jgi:hypothetical protein|nr:hypothetical protein [Marinifilaceae bacterium]
MLLRKNQKKNNQSINENSIKCKNNSRTSLNQYNIIKIITVQKQHNKKETIQAKKTLKIKIIKH